ncbi:MAG TPA: hypothetical protein VGX23_21375 [Actinocrinis sp.]|nr:hypothetical protein [Actinocrinis sp.]
MPKAGSTRPTLPTPTPRQTLIGAAVGAAALGVAGFAWSVRQRRRRRAAESAAGVLAWCTASTRLTAKEIAIVDALPGPGTGTDGLGTSFGTGYGSSVAPTPSTPAPWTVGSSALPSPLPSVPDPDPAPIPAPPITLKCALDSDHLGPHLVLSHAYGDDQHWLLWTPSTRQITQLDPCPVTGSTAQYGRWGRVCRLPASHEGRHTFEQTGRIGSHVRVL